MPDTDTESPSVHVLFARAFNDITPVGKEGHQSGSGGSFSFRQVDDVYDAVHAALAKHGLFFLPRCLERIPEQRTTKGGGIQNVVHLLVEFTFYGPRGDSIVMAMWGEGSDSGDKATSKAATMALKYALIYALCIPLGDMPDPDSESPPETRAPTARQQKAAQKPPAKVHTKADVPAPGMSVSAQWGALSQLAEKLGWDEAEKHRQAGVKDSLKELTAEQARDLAQAWAKMLTARAAEKKGAPQ